MIDPALISHPDEVDDLIGEWAAAYPCLLRAEHKMQFAEGYDKSWYFNRPGKKIRAFDTPLGRCGMLICNDRWNPLLQHYAFAVVCRPRSRTARIKRMKPANKLSHLGKPTRLHKP